jgi:hypothetical protein
MFHAIYKKQENHFTIRVTTSQKDPRKDFPFCNVVPGGGRPARVEHNSGEPRRSLAGGGWGGGLGLIRIRFGGSDGGGAAPASGHAGGQRRWPPRLPFPGEGAREELVNGRRAMVGVAEVEEGATWLAVGPQPELATTGRKDAGTRRGCDGRGLRDAVKGSGAFMGAVRTS